MFTAAWNGRYKGYVEYRPNSELVDVDPAGSTLKLDFEDVRADVINVIPPQRAGAIARELGMANANGSFCEADFLPTSRPRRRTFMYSAMQSRPRR